MSLLYVVDGYNVIRHPACILSKKIRDQKSALVDHIRSNRLCGSLKNKVIIVFDGYPDTRDTSDYGGNFEIVFSRDTSADSVIKKILEKKVNPRNAVVVTDDKEIRYFIRSFGAKPLSVEEFIAPRKDARPAHHDELKTDLNFSQMNKINQELKDLWLD